MIYPISIYGDPVLRKKAKSIEKSHAGLEQIIENMWETMYSSDGVGLAAPQAGMSVRLFVVDGTDVEDEEPGMKYFKKVFIHPEIIKKSGDPRIMNEGCLSLPEIREDVERPDVVRIRYFDENFELHDEVYEGYAGRIIQHEYDHLEGVLFIDHISPLRRRLIKSKLRAIIHGKVKPSYRTKMQVR